MLIRTDSSLFGSALTYKEGISNSGNTVVLSDNTLFSVLPFVYECRAQNKKPVIGLEKEVSGAKYLFIVLNEKGYYDLLISESFSNFTKLFDNQNVLSILSEVINPKEEIKHTKYAIESNNEVSNALLNDYADIILHTKIVNGISEKDLYKKALIEAVGNTSNVTDTLLKSKFNCDSGDFSELEKILEPVKDYFKFGDPTPPKFKFLEKYTKEYGIYHEGIIDQELFEYLCRKGLSKRFNGNAPIEYVERLNYEIKVIREMRFPGYMLIVWDFVNYAKSHDIPTGPGRGSAAGSLVSYALGITNLDPLKYHLLFERFLNPERVSFPDIDMDFSREKRGDIIDYVVEAYGRDYVAQVITFGKIGGKSAIRDAARAQQLPLALADKIAKAIPEKPGMTLEKAYNQNKDFWDKWLKEDFQANQIWKGAEQITGMTRNLGVHAAGLIIGTEKITDKAPLYDINGVQAVGYEGKYLEDVDLVKFDFLGLKTLDVISNSVKLIKQNKGIDIDINSIDLSQPEVYKTISQGKTIGMFQIESPGMKELNKRMGPDKFEDLIAILALYRPGPMDSGMLDSFVKRKRGEEKVSYFYPEMEEVLKPILSPTYGVIVYQEQVMQIVQAIGGFSLGYADIIRRAMGKKKDMSVYNEEFATGAEKNGFSKKNASELFDLIEKFAGYGFNKSHSAAYAMVTFQTAWLKTFYPVEFMTALINSEIENTDKMAAYVKEAKDMGIVVKNPNILESDSFFKINEKEEIVFGLKAIKGVGNGSESIKSSIEKFIDCKEENSLLKLLSITQIDTVKEIDKTEKAIARVEKQLQKCDSDIQKSQIQIAKFEEKQQTKPLTEFQYKSMQKHIAKIGDIESKKAELSSHINDLKNQLEDLKNNDKAAEKINKRVFEALASVGALDCFGYSRKFLIENATNFINTKIQEIDFSKAKEEYHISEIISLEEKYTSLIFTSPFTPDILDLEDQPEMPILAIIAKENRYKKNGEIFINLKLMDLNGKIVEVSDFNKKSEKLEIGEIISATISTRNNYKNLQHIRKLDKSNYNQKKKVLKLNIFDTLPEDISGFNSIKVYDNDNFVMSIHK